MVTWPQLSVVLAILAEATPSTTRTLNCLDDICIGKLLSTANIVNVCVVLSLAMPGVYLIAMASSADVPLICVMVVLTLSDINT